MFAEKKSEQKYLSLHLCLEVQIVHGNELRLFLAKALVVLAAVGTIFNVFSYDALLCRDSYLSHPRRRAVSLRDEQIFRRDDYNYVKLFI